MTGIPSRRLRHRVLIQRPEETQNLDTGAVELAWVEFGRRWSEYRAASAREFIAAAQYDSEVKGRFTLRAGEGITDQMRVLHRGKVFAVLGVLPDPDSGLEYITLPVSEGVIFDGR